MSSVRSWKQNLCGRYSNYIECTILYSTDADTVLSKKQFTVAGSVVTVSPHTVEPKDTAAQNTSNTSEEDIVVKVTGITPDMSEEMLSLYFEHERKSGGGDIKEFDVDYQKGEAVVTFENPTGLLLYSDILFSSRV